MRIIFNTSFIINQEIEQEWIGFIKEHYISSLQNTGIISDVIFTKVSIDQPDGKTYSLQLIFDSDDRLQLFTDKYLPAIEEKIIANYKNRYLCFSSLLHEL
jgi:hypothetical protein